MAQGAVYTQDIHRDESGRVLEVIHRVIPPPSPGCQPACPRCRAARPCGCGREREVEHLFDRWRDLLHRLAKGPRDARYWCGREEGQ